MNYINLKLVDEIADLLTKCGFTSTKAEDEYMFDIFILRLLELLEKEQTKYKDKEP